MQFIAKVRIPTKLAYIKNLRSEFLESRSIQIMKKPPTESYF